MKSKVQLLLIAVITLSFAFNNPPEKKGMTLTCELSACERVDSVFLYEFNGVLFKKIQSAVKEEGQKFTFSLQKTDPRFYYIGLGGNNVKPIILGTEKEVIVKGTCNNFRGAKLENSTINMEYEVLKNEMNQLKNEMGGIIRQYQRSRQDPNKRKVIEAKMGEVDKKRLHMLDSLKKANPYFAKIAALNTYLSFQNHGEGFGNEIDYFAKNYFQFVDFSDDDFTFIPWVFEGMKSYAVTLSSVGLNEKQQQTYIDAILSKVPEDSRTYQLAIGGIMAGLKQKNHPNFVTYGNQYVEKYKASELESAAHIRGEVKKIGAFMIGGEAPNFSMNTPEGEARNLTDYRGKVLLVDFWASWCGPCRRENPHVKKMYSKYQDKGFEILGVSLDKQRERWVQAIEKDGLPWPHVSDLKGWGNEAAKMYGVRSIPHTILLDEEGKILARNLRGPTLEAKLAEIFGE